MLYTIVASQKRRDRINCWKQESIYSRLLASTRRNGRWAAGNATSLATDASVDKDPHKISVEERSIFVSRILLEGQAARISSWKPETVIIVAAFFVFTNITMELGQENSRVPTPPPQLHLIFERPGALNTGGRAALAALASVLSGKNLVIQPNWMDNERCNKYCMDGRDYMGCCSLVTIPEEWPLLEWNAENIPRLNS